MKAISDDINNYYLHIAYRSEQPNRNTIFELNAFGVSDPQPSVVIGTGINTFINKAAYAECTRWDNPYTVATFNADGEWYHFDIPMTYFTNHGLLYNNNFVNSDGETGQASLHYVLLAQKIQSVQQLNMMLCLSIKNRNDQAICFVKILKY